MSKALKVFIAMAVAMAVAAPAMAEIKLNGYYRLQGINESAFDLSEDGTSSTGIDQRLRMKLTNTLNDNVKFVYYGEVDTPWGDASNAGGGQLGADGVQLQTKNAYLDLTFGDWGVRTGVQGLSDNNNAFLFADDMAAAKVTGKLGALDVTGFYSKWDEGSYAYPVREGWDDTDFWGLQLAHSYGDTASVGFDVYFNDINEMVVETGTTTTIEEIEALDLNGDSVGTGFYEEVTVTNTETGSVEDFYYSLNGNFRAGSLGLDGWVIMRDFSGEFASGDVDGSAIAATVAANMVLQDMGDAGLRFTYISGDDGEDYDRFDDAAGGFQFYNENLMLLGTDISYNNFNGGRLAYTTATTGGTGLVGINAKANLKFGNGMYGKFGAGYFMTAEDNVDGGAEAPGDVIGTEIAAKVGKKVLENVDVSLRGAYAILGDYFDGKATDVVGADPEDLHKVVFMVNVGF